LFQRYIGRSAEPLIIDTNILTGAFKYFSKILALKVFKVIFQLLACGMYYFTTCIFCILNSKYNTHPFNGPLSGTTMVSRYQKGKTNGDFTEARNSEWQWHQLGHMQVCTSLQADNHASTPPLFFLQAGCPSCRTTNSIKALKAFKNQNTNTGKDMNESPIKNYMNYYQ